MKIGTCRGRLNALVSGDSLPALAMLVTCDEIVSNNKVSLSGQHPYWSCTLLGDCALLGKCKGNTRIS